jgi:hypothetical protein
MFTKFEDANYDTITNNTRDFPLPLARAACKSPVKSVAARGSSCCRAACLRCFRNDAI